MTFAGISWLEAVAVLTGAISVYLSVRQNIWSWPTAIVNVSAYTLLFFRSGLYSDMGLQVVYFILSVYGWYEWLHGGPQSTELRVSRATARQWAWSAALGLVLWFSLARFTSMFQSASIPELDAALTTVSLVAQWMMTKKILENWILWIAADIAYVPMFVYKKLYPTAGLYAVFLVLAILGYVQWRRSWRERPA